MVFAFPWLGGLPLAFLRARGARRGGYCSRAVGSDVSRLRCVSCASATCGFASLCYARAWLSIFVRAPRGGVVERRRRRVLSSSSAIGMCGGGMVAFWGTKVTILGESVCSLQDDVSEHGPGSLEVEHTARWRVGGLELRQASLDL